MGSRAMLAANVTISSSTNEAASTMLALTQSATTSPPLDASTTVTLSKSSSPSPSVTIAAYSQSSISGDGDFATTPLTIPTAQTITAQEDLAASPVVLSLPTTSDVLSEISLNSPRSHVPSPLFATSSAPSLLRDLTMTTTTFLASDSAQAGKLSSSLAKDLTSASVLSPIIASLMPVIAGSPLEATHETTIPFTDDETQFKHKDEAVDGFIQRFLKFFT